MPFKHALFCAGPGVPPRPLCGTDHTFSGIWHWTIDVRDAPPARKLEGDHSGNHRRREELAGDGLEIRETPGERMHRGDVDAPIRWK